MTPDPERAKQIIVEILRHCPDGIGKTKLFKAFWAAHLYFAREHPGFLSDWPVVRMPQGPGIDKANQLIGELKNEGLLETIPVMMGPLCEINHRLKTDDGKNLLSEDAVNAIEKAVKFILPKTAEACSEYSHERSRSWNQTENGKELDIYSDLIPEDEYTQREEDTAKLAAVVGEVFSK